MPKRIIKKIHHLTIPHEGNGYKPHSLRHHSLAVYSILILLVKVFVGMGLFLSFPTEGEFSTITTNRIIELTNEVRVENGLEPLQTNHILNQSAAAKLADMFDDNYFAHTSPDGVRPWSWFKEVGYNYTYAGENLAMNFIEAEDTVAAWMNSPTHRDNMLSDNYNEIGVAVGIGMIDGQETTLVVQHFGKRFVRVAGDESFRPVASEVPADAPQIGGQGGEVTKEALSQEVVFEGGESFLSKLVKYSARFFFVLLVFIVINLLLTIFIRLEIQHKSIIFHSILVILLSVVMLLWKVNFMEGLGKLVIV